MTRHRTILAVLALGVLPACIIPVPVPPGTSGSIVIVEGDSCGARGLQDYVGQNESVVRGTVFQAPGPVRVIGPDDVVTQELNPQRVNFRTNAAGTIVAVDCG